MRLSDAQIGHQGSCIGALLLSTTCGTQANSDTIPHFRYVLRGVILFGMGAPIVCQVLPVAARTLVFSRSACCPGNNFSPSRRRCHVCVENIAALLLLPVRYALADGSYDDNHGCKLNLAVTAGMT